MLGPWNPQKRSPVHHEITQSGAKLVEISGWHVAEDFGNAEKEALGVRSGTGISDISAHRKWEIKGSELSEWAKKLLSGNVPEVGRLTCLGFNSFSRVSQNESLFVLGMIDEAIPALISESDPQSSCLHILDRTDGYGGFLLCGPKVRAVLAGLTPLDLQESRFPDLSCAAGPLATTRVFIVRRDRFGLPAYEIFFNREYGQYLWRAVMEAGRESKITPFGIRAVQLLDN